MNRKIAQLGDFSFFICICQKKIVTLRDFSKIYYCK